MSTDIRNVPFLVVLKTVCVAASGTESGKLSTQRNVRHGGPLAPFALENSPNAADKPDTDPISML
jgi:hypothetical protein